MHASKSSQCPAGRAVVAKKIRGIGGRGPGLSPGDNLSETDGWGVARVSGIDHHGDPLGRGSSRPRERASSTPSRRGANALGEVLGYFGACLRARYGLSRASVQFQRTTVSQKARSAGCAQCPLCLTSRMGMNCGSPGQGNEARMPDWISCSTAMRGSTPYPNPARMHCLISSTLPSSVTGLLAPWRAK